MARRIPYVADGALHVTDAPGRPEIAVGSPSWVAWLRDPATRSFSFQGPSGRFTARKEHRVHGGEYWTAYRKRDGRLRKAYLGKDASPYSDIAALFVFGNSKVQVSQGLLGNCAIRDQATILWSRHHHSPVSPRRYGTPVR